MLKLKNKQKPEIHFTSLLIGILAATIVFLWLQNQGLREKLVTNGDLTQSESVSESEDSTEVGSVIKEYLTDLKKFSVKTTDGTNVTFHTPKDWYSLTDQYQENLQAFYANDSVEVSNMFVVGNADTTGNSTSLINAAPISEVSKVMKKVYGDEYKEEDMLVSEAYTYMTTGKLPEELPDNYKIDELETIKVGDVSYKLYEVNYDTTYTDDTSNSNEEGTESTEAKETVVHTQKIACYSDTEDPIEIIMYMAEFNKDKAISLIKEFLGV